VTVHATLSAGPAHLILSAREGPAPGTWRYNPGDGANSRIQYGRIAGKTDHMDVLKYAAGICRDAYAPGTTERGLLEQSRTALQYRDGLVKGSNESLNALARQLNAEFANEQAAVP
jgi:hypothetical protein